MQSSQPLAVRNDGLQWRSSSRDPPLATMQPCSSKTELPNFACSATDYDDGITGSPGSARHYAHHTSGGTDGLRVLPAARCEEVGVLL
jgi:hypothetical protein